MSDEKKPGDVVDIKKKQEEKAVKKSKPKKAEFYKTIARAIDCDPFNFLTGFPVRLHTIEVKSGLRLPVKETSPGVVEITEEEMVAYSIINYCHNIVVPTGKDQYSFEVDEAKKCAKFWIAHSKPIATPKMVRWADEDGFTFRRLPWPLKAGPTPVFDEMMARTTNSDALMAFIGSLFVEESDRQTYCWIHGQGQNGKGALSRFLKDALGNAYSAQVVPNAGDKFWTSGLLGSRLVVFGDCNNTTFVTTGLFKGLTGGDPVRVEMKNKQPFTAELNCKYMFMSNERPRVNSEKADLRRLILCEMAAIECDPDPQYQRKLWAEGGHFLANCLHKYAVMCPDHAAIKAVDNGELLDWISTVEEEYESFFQRHFELNPIGWIVPSELGGRLKEFKDGRKEQGFRSWMERTHGIKKKSKKVDGAAIKGYPGANLIYIGDE